MIKNIELRMNLNLTLEVDLETGEVIGEPKVKTIGIIPISNIRREKEAEQIHTIGPTENKYGILTLGSKSSVGKLIPNNTEVDIYINGEKFESRNINKKIKTHSVTQGRIDGLTELYDRYKELEAFRIIYIKAQIDENMEKAILDIKITKDVDEEKKAKYGK